MDKTIADKVTAARVALINGHPFFGALALRLQVHATNAVPTMGVDGRNLFYNPAWADSLPFEQLCGVMAHEVMHCALAHHVRFEKRDPDIWNQDCDHAINPLLREAGFELPSDGLSVDRPRYPGKAAEEIYSALMNARSKQPKEPTRINPNPTGQGGSGGGSGNNQSGKSKPTPDQKKEGKDGSGADQPEKSKSPKSKPTSKGGGAADDEADDLDDADEADGDGEGEPEDSKPEPQHPQDVGGCGSFSPPTEEDGEPASVATMAEQARDWQVATSQALSVAKRAGNMPGSMMTAIEGLRKPQVDWREQLRRFVDSASKQNYCWTPPNRRYIADDMYLPSLTNEGLGDIVFAIDTSGSMNDAALHMAVDELNSILTDLQPESVHIIQCDTRVNEVREVHAGDYPIAVDAKGRGGTALTPVFNEIRERDLRPVCMIYFTDLYVDDFPVEPEYPVLWASPPNSSTIVPPFGESIRIIADGRE